MEKSKLRGKVCPLDFPFIHAQGKLGCSSVLFVVQQVQKPLSTWWQYLKL